MIPRSIFILMLVFPTLGKSADLPETNPGDILIDVGTKEARASLGYGWSSDEKHQPSKQTSCWISRIEADVWIDLAAPAAKKLSIHAQPLFLPRKVQRMAVYVNGDFVTEWAFPREAGYKVYETSLAADLLTEGRNRLTFRMAYKRNPHPSDSRELSANVDWILLQGTDL